MRIVIWNEENPICDCVEINISKQTSHNVHLEQKQTILY